MAVSIGRGTLASVQGARDAAGVLLTFKSITGETFRETLKLTQDLAAVGFGTMKTAALQLGKALEEPEIGLSALRRVGVSFNEQQKEQIKVLSMTGRQMEAQTLIIKALKDQVGGAGEGAAGGLAGAFDTLGENVNLFFERSVKGRAIVDFLTNSINMLSEALGNQIHNLTTLPDTAPELQNLLDGNIEKLRFLEEALKNANASKSRFFDSGEAKKNRAELALQIKFLNQEIEAIRKKQSFKEKEVSVVNKADLIAEKLATKRERNAKREIEDLGATATQLRINNDLRKLEDSLISKLGEGAEARRAILEILAQEEEAIRKSATANQEFIEEFKRIEEIAGNIGKEFEKVGDTVVDAFLRGKAGALDFKNILRELIISIQKTIIQTLILDQVNKFVKDSIMGIFAPKVPSSGGGNFGSHGGSAGGGTVQQGRPELVGERGPELFVPNGAGKIVNGADTKSSMSGGGGVSVVQNLNFAVGITNTVRAEVMNMLPAIQQSTISAVADAKQRGGKFSKAFGA